MTEAIIEMSAELGELAKALPKAQSDMGEVFKTANNPAFRSKYADLASVVEAVVPALNKQGITMLQPASFDGDRVNVATMFLHESGQWLRCTMSVLVTKKDAHGIGSAQTYCRRYGLMSLCGKPVYMPHTSYMVCWQPKRSLWSRITSVFKGWGR